MKQMQVNPDTVVYVPLSGVARVLNPVVFKEGDSYCCLLGPDPQSGIFGCGPTPQDAMNDWDNRLHETIAKSSESNVAKEVIAILGDTKHNL